MGRVHYEESDWEKYAQVNRQFAKATLEEAQDNDYIWVHDYHLGLVPCTLRQERPSARIAFFWHMPFPAAELFRTFPWRHAFLDSLLACDLIGFHIPEYAENFMAAAKDVLNAEVNGDWID
jgi:trehalose-6-phosphate synthase